MRAPRQPIMLLLALMVCCVVRVAPAAAQPDPSARAAQFEHNAVIARQQAAALRKSITSWEDGFIKNNRVRAATAPDAKTRAAYANVVKTQEAAVDKMRSQAAFLAKSAEYDDAQAAHIRRHEPIDPRAPVNPAANASVASSGAAGPANNRPAGYPGAFPLRPSAIRTPTPPAKEVLAYLAVATQDAARAKKYIAIAEAELTSYGPRIDEANALAERLLNKPAAQFLKDHPNTITPDINHPYTWSIHPKIKEYWTQQRPSTGAAASLKNIDLAVKDTNNFIRPVMSFDSGAAAQREAGQFRDIDRLERDLAGDLKAALVDRLSLRDQQLNWDITFLDAQSTFRTLNNWIQWTKLENPIYKVLYAERHAADTNGTFAKLEPGFFADTMARNAPLCTAAAKQDAVYIAQTAGRIQTLIDQFKADRRHILEEFKSVVTDLYKDKSGVKAELSAAMLRYVQGLIADKNFGSPLREVSVQIHWQVFNYDFGQWVSSQGGPVVEADARTMANTPSCRSWIDQMPKDLAARFPAITPDFSEHQVDFSVNFVQQLEKAAIAQNETLHVAQGGVWPQDGP